jgi:hypothetical protein
MDDYKRWLDQEIFERKRGIKMRLTGPQTRLRNKRRRFDEGKMSELQTALKTYLQYKSSTKD